jgi:hypothetical protein
VTRVAVLSTASVLSTALIAVLCSLGALVSAHSCAGDGSFELDSPLARPSGYCRATHFPGFPDTAGSALLVGTVYVAPVLLAALGWFALTRGNRRIGAASICVASVWAVTALVVSIAASDVGYAGV